MGTIAFAAVLALLYVNSTCGAPNFAVSDETRLRKYVLDTYVREIRPKAQTKIWVEFSLITINDVETKTQTFSATGYFNMRWNDSRLAWNSTRFGGVSLLVTDEHTVWRPPLVISNEVTSVKVISDRAIPIRVDESGAVEWAPPLIMQCDCDIEVQYYPFDEQECSIDMTTWGYQLNEVNLKANKINVDDFNDNNEWELTGFRLERTEKSRNNGDQVSKLSFVFTVRRLPSYYVLSAVVPSVLMSLLAPVAFLYPPKGGEKLSYIITVFLAYALMVTFVFDQLPPAASKPSILSIYLVIVTCIGAVSVVFTILVLDLHFRDEDDNPIPSWLNAFARFLRLLVCRSCNKKNQDRKLTWKEIAEILDAIFFRITSLMTLIIMTWLLGSFYLI